MALWTALCNVHPKMIRYDTVD